MRDIDVKRSVTIIHETCQTSDRLNLLRIIIKVALQIIECHRPKSVNRRRLPGREIWSDVETSAAGVTTITIQRAFVETRTQGIVEKSTKTDRARRIPLGELATEALRRQRALQAEERLALGSAYRDTGLVFQGRLGGPLAPYLATDAFRSICSKLNLRASLHDLRHTAATWMLAGGIDVRTVASVLGHSSASTTLGIYAHVIAGEESRAVAAIDERFRSSGS